MCDNLFRSFARIHSLSSCSFARTTLSFFISLSILSFRIYLRSNARRSLSHFDVPRRGYNFTWSRPLLYRSVKILTYFNDSNGLSYIRVRLAYVDACARLPSHCCLSLGFLPSPLCMYILSKKQRVIGSARQTSRHKTLAFGFFFESAAGCYREHVVPGNHDVLGRGLNLIGNAFL